MFGPKVRCRGFGYPLNRGKIISRYLQLSFAFARKCSRRALCGRHSLGTRCTRGRDKTVEVKINFEYAWLGLGEKSKVVVSRDGLASGEDKTEREPVSFSLGNAAGVQDRISCPGCSLLRIARIRSYKLPLSFALFEVILIKKLNMDSLSVHESRFRYSTMAYRHIAENLNIYGT